MCTRIDNYVTHNKKYNGSIPHLMITVFKTRRKSFKNVSGADMPLQLVTPEPVAVTNLSTKFDDVGLPD